MDRLSRRHDKLLTHYLMLRRERIDAESDGSPRGAHAERLAVRERALVGSIRRLRVQLGLPANFDPEHESARLHQEVSTHRRIGTLRGRDSDPLPWSDRPRVKPVPAQQHAPIQRNGNRDVIAPLVAAAARHWGRRAAEEVLEHRMSPARGHIGTPVVAWPEKPLARTANGEIYAGSAGRQMGELVARAFDGDQANAHAAIAIRSYVDEFTTCVTTALSRELVIAAELGHPNDNESTGRLTRVRRDLAQAACERIAVEVRAVRHIGGVTAAQVASVAGLDDNP